MTASSFLMTPAFYDYYQQHFVREKQLFHSLREATQSLPGAHMLMAPEQAQALRLILTLLAPKHILEIGTFTGYSALLFADILQGNGKVVTCDKGGPWIEVARTFWEKAGYTSCIELLQGDALETVTRLSHAQPGHYDFIYVDADKKNYPAYYELALTLIRNGGMIIIDNVFWYGKIAEDTVEDATTVSIRSLNQIIVEDVRVLATTIPLGDGCTVLIKK